MNRRLAAHLARHRAAGLLVDTNILLLLLVGHVNVLLIGTFKRTRQFARDDFVLLESTLQAAGRLLTTPSILTEVSNLGGQLSEPHRERFFVQLQQCVGTASELFQPSKDLAQREPFLRFGLTDTAVEHAAQDGALVLTDDFRLSGYLESHGLAVINFNHLRFSDDDE